MRERGKFSLAPTIDFNREGEIDMPLPDGSRPMSAPQRVIDPNYNPFRVDKGLRMKDTAKPYSSNAAAGWEQLYEMEPRTKSQEQRLNGLDYERKRRY